MVQNNYSKNSKQKDIVQNSDSQNYIIDLDVFPIKDPVTFGAELKALTGVVEQGLFTNMTETVLIGTPDGVKVQTLG